MPYTYKYGDRPLDGVTVQRAVGRGGFGEVYYALTDSGKQIALKYLRDHPEVELRGIGHVMNLKSPHLITIYDVKQNAARENFVLMEYVSGPSLRELMTAEPQGVGPQKAAFFLKGIARGLDYLHERGIVHRDLKPANIFYDDGYVKIGDYGLSKHISTSQHSGQTVSVGTVHYMAPEIGSGSYTQAIDIYALGVILYEMLTGRLPYSGSSMAEILMRHLRDQPDLTGVPEPFARVIAKALAKDPADRYQNVNEMLAEVMDSADLSASVDSFDAASLTRLPRMPMAEDAQTVTAGGAVVPPVPPIPPAMDVRDLRDRGALPPELQRRLSHLHRRMEQKARRLERKLGPRHRVQRVDDTPGNPQWRAHLMTLIFVLVAVCGALAFFTNNGRHIVPLALIYMLYLTGGVVGLLLAHFRMLRSRPGENGLFERVAAAGLVAVCMLPAVALATDGRETGAAQLIFPLLGVVLICDLRRRIEDGRAGRISWQAASWPAGVGFGVVAVMQIQGIWLPAIVLCGMLSVMVQAAGALWPLRRESTPLPGILGAHHGPHADEPRTPTQPHVEMSGWSATAPTERGSDSAAPAMAGTQFSPAMALVPRSTALRTVYWLLAALMVFGVLGAFGGSRAAVRDPEVRGVMVFIMLGSLAWLPFFVIKARQQYRMPFFRGTGRWLLVSGGLMLIAIAPAVTIADPRDPEVRLVASFLAAGGLVVAALGALLPLLLGLPAGAAPVSTTTVRQKESETVPADDAGELAAAQPSFVGRTARSGVSLIGKLLLLAAVVLAIAQHPAHLLYGRQAPGPIGELLRQPLPPGVILLMLAAGSALLLIARISEGLRHFMRGMCGCALVGIGAVIAFMKGEFVGRLFQTRDPGLISSEPMMALLLAIAALLVGVLLLSWPSSRQSRPIVL